MKTVFLNPFLLTDLNEKITSVSFKIGSFDYIAKQANVKLLKLILINVSYKSMML